MKFIVTFLLVLSTQVFAQSDLNEIVKSFGDSKCDSYTCSYDIDTKVIYSNIVDDVEQPVPFCSELFMQYMARATEGSAEVYYNGSSKYILTEKIINKMISGIIVFEKKINKSSSEIKKLKSALMEHLGKEITIFSESDRYGDVQCFELKYDDILFQLVIGAWS